MTSTDNGIYFFLGNIASHVIHALSLHKELGGTFVVTSKKAQLALQSYNIPVICIDDIPYIWMWRGKRLHKITEYTELDQRFVKTIDFLNTHAKVVLFYELFDLISKRELTNPKKVFLTHGNMLKNYFQMHPRRLEIIKQYDYMAALGPFMKREFVHSGIPKEKLVDIGIARTDEVSAIAGRVDITDKLLRLNVPSGKPIVSYLPTFWGDSSVEELGPQIIENISDDYIVLFRPHPQTPQKILKKYRKLVARPNVFYLHEASDQPSLIDIYTASSAIIGDLSSVMLEALLLDKPLIFADPDSRSNVEPHTQLAEIEKFSPHISMKQARDVTEIISKAIDAGIDKKLWNQSKNTSFFNANGGSVDSIAMFVRSLL